MATKRTKVVKNKKQAIPTKPKPPDGDKAKFEQLMDDAVFGVTKKKTGK